MKASDIEFSLPKPSYTIDTLTYLREKYPQYMFALIMGEDNLASLKKWKNSELLIQQNQIIVYPRIVENVATDETSTHPNIQKINAPIIELSATEIRNMLKSGKNTRPMLPPEVFEYLDGSYFYQ
jgi:nicotinate-nucleotide adenylyltransferase